LVVLLCILLLALSKYIAHKPAPELFCDVVLLSNRGFKDAPTLAQYSFEL
jgi:hypothetical protein